MPKNLIFNFSWLFFENIDLKSMSFALSSKTSNFFFGNGFSRLVKIEHDIVKSNGYSFIFRVFNDQSNSESFWMDLFETVSFWMHRVTPVS